MSRLTFVALAIFIVLAAAAFYAAVFLGGNFLGTGKKVKVMVGGAEFLADIADSVVSRARGLSGRDGLGENEGLLFIFPAPARHEFWMKDMKFPIDIIWVSGGRVIGFAENAEPEPGRALWELKRYSPPEPAEMVLEVNAGTVNEKGIKAGDKISYSEK